MIKLDYKDGRSLHEQIEDGLKKLIIGGILKPDEQLPSVRELSVSLTVNPNTVQRAYKQLENDAFIYSVKGRGSFVMPAADTRSAERTEELYKSLAAAVRELMYLGERKESIEKTVNGIFGEKGERK